jgi:hypothetical protein
MAADRPCMELRKCRPCNAIGAHLAARRCVGQAHADQRFTDVCVCSPHHIGGDVQGQRPRRHGCRRPAGVGCGLLAASWRAVPCRCGGALQRPGPGSEPGAAGAHAEAEQPARGAEAGRAWQPGREAWAPRRHGGAWQRAGSACTQQAGHVAWCCCLCDMGDSGWERRSGRRKSVTPARTYLYCCSSSSAHSVCSSLSHTPL